MEGASCVSKQFDTKEWQEANSEFTAPVVYGRTAEEGDGTKCTGTTTSTLNAISRSIDGRLAEIFCRSNRQSCLASRKNPRTETNEHTLGSIISNADEGGLAEEPAR